MPRKMSKQDALIEARRRWGRSGSIFIDPFWPKEGPSKHFSVGHCTDVANNAFYFHGTGETWEEAFTDANDHPCEQLPEERDAPAFRCRSAGRETH
jgi:hypothetical protein